MINELSNQLTTGNEFQRPAEWVDSTSTLDVPESTKLHPETNAMADDLAVSEGVRLIKYAQGRVRGQEYIQSAEDLSQAALLAFMERYRDEPPQLTVQQGHMSILWGILKHKISSDHRRGALQRSHVYNVEMAEELSEVVTMQGIEDLIVEKEAAGGVLHEIFALLTDRQKRIMEMTAEGYTSEEIAREVGTSPGAIRIARHKVIKRVSQVALELCRNAEISAGIIERDPLLEKEKVVKAPRVSLAAVHNKIAQDIRERYGQGHQYVDLKAADYLAPWYLASRVLASFLSYDDYRAINRRALIVCPNNALATDFRKYVGGITRRKISDLASMDHTKAPVVVDTPENIATTTAAFEYIAFAENTPQELQMRLSRDSRFLIRLTDPESQTIHEANEYATPTYAQTNDPRTQRLIWEPKDSTRYVHELRFRTGMFPDMATLKALEESGTGPNLKRLFKTFGGFHGLIDCAMAELL